MNQPGNPRDNRGRGRVAPRVACTRMYNAGEKVTGLWARLVAAAARQAGVPLEFILHPFPRDIRELWARPDLGLGFICGRAFALDGRRHRPLAVPLRRTAAGPAPRYHTKLLVRADSPHARLEDTFGHRLAWTAEHSLSGCLAVKWHLAPYAAGRRAPLHRPVGPLHTPGNCLRALVAGEVDLAPLDDYWHELLTRHAPEALAPTRVLAVTREYPLPLLVASAELDEATSERIRAGLFAAAALPALGPLLAELGLAGFAAPELDAYAGLGAA